MNLTKKLGLATVLVLTSNFAHAAVYDIGAGSQPNRLITVDAGDFTSTFNFVLTQDSNFSAIAHSSEAYGSGYIEFLSFTVGGFSGEVFNDPGVSSFAVTSPLHETPMVLSAGSYSLELKGYASVGGINYAFTSSVSPVPEPSSIALMLGGLGLVGFMAARRAKKV